MKTLREINQTPVSESLEIIVTGSPRSAGVIRERSISRLLEEAELCEGIYGPENKPVSKDMLVVDLLSWHADFDWSFNHMPHTGNSTWYGFSEANCYDEPAWFHSRDAAERFAIACGWEDFEIEETDDIPPFGSVMDDPDRPWQGDKSKYCTYEIHAVSIHGHHLHWNGEKFTDQGEPWNFASIEEAKAEHLDRENMETITLYGWTECTDDNPDVPTVAITTL